MNKAVKIFSLVALISLFCAGAACAAGAGMPWEGPLDRILRSVTGPVAKVVSVLAIVATGLALALGEGGGTMRKMLMIVFGLSIAFSATTFILPLLGFAGGASF